MEVRESPQMTFTAMCRFLVASHVRQLSILRDQKFPHPGPIRSYDRARTQTIDFAVDGRPLDPDDLELEPYEREVIGDLIEHDWSPPAPLVQRAPPERAPFVVHGVQIDVEPDLRLGDSSGRKAMSGALKLYFIKHELSPRTGRWMASLLYHDLMHVEHDPHAHPDLCLIYDVRRDEYHSAGRSYSQLFRNVESACRFIRAIWPDLEPPARATSERPHEDL